MEPNLQEIQQRRAEKKHLKKALKAAAAAKQKAATIPDPTVHITVALNGQRQKCTLVEVKESADLNDLWKIAKDKLKVKEAKTLQEGTGAIYLERTQKPIQQGETLQHNDTLLYSRGEPVEFGSLLAKVLSNGTPDLPRGTPDYLLVLDFEATCNNRPAAAPKPQEIIEFPTLLLNVQTGEIESEFHYYIKPDVHPQLSAFCTELTGINQCTIDQKGISLWQAIDFHREWLEERRIVPLTPELEREETGGVAKQKTYLYLTCGDWDLATCLPRQLAYHNKKVEHAGFRRWINVKEAFRLAYDKKAGGMTSLLSYFGLKLQGRHHSGIDDCRNIARICQVMLQEGWQPMATSSSMGRYR